jgi:hypothetical protein
MNDPETDESLSGRVAALAFTGMLALAILLKAYTLIFGVPTGWQSTAETILALSRAAPAA